MVDIILETATDVGNPKLQNASRALLSELGGSRAMKLMASRQSIGEKYTQHAQEAEEKVRRHLGAWREQRPSDNGLGRGEGEEAHPPSRFFFSFPIDGWRADSTLRDGALIVLVFPFHPDLPLTDVGAKDV